MLRRIVKLSWLLRRLKLKSRRERRDWLLRSVRGKFSPKSKKHLMLRSNVSSKSAKKMKPAASKRLMRNAVDSRKKTV